MISLTNLEWRAAARDVGQRLMAGVETLGRRENCSYRWLLVLTLAFHVVISLIGLDSPYFGAHVFRQAQTAISTSFLLEDGVRLDYSTPVLGKPWSIPMEFPLYQMVTAAVSLVPGLSLIAAGRLVSLAAFYLGLFAIWKIFRALGLDPKRIYACLALICVCPIYLYWSHTFMIESLAFSLTLFHIFYVLKVVLDRPTPVRLSLAFLIGSTAALAKVTTFLVGLIPVAVALLWLGYRKFRETGWRGACVALLWRGAIVAGLPFTVGWIWVKYSDSIKSRNPLANGTLTSDALHNWNYGTLQQKLSPATWLHFSGMTSQQVFGLAPHVALTAAAMLILLAVVFFAARRASRAPLPLLLMLCFIAPLTVFTNLYFKHDYYWYANAAFLVSALGLLITSPALERWSSGRAGGFRVLGLGTVILAMALAYLYSPKFKMQLRRKDSDLKAASFVQAHTAPSDVLLIYGCDWSAKFPFSAHRRALMDRKNLPLDDPRIAASLDALDGEFIGAMVLNKKAKIQLSPEEVTARVARFRLQAKPGYEDDIYRVFLRQLE